MSEWIDVKDRVPEKQVATYGDFKVKPYVLVCDSKSRMSIAYPVRYATGEIRWTMAKPIGGVTHWMPLPAMCLGPCMERLERGK